MNRESINRRVLASMTGRAKLEALLTDLGYPTLRTIAEAIDEPESEISRCFSGYQGRAGQMDRIRSKVAQLAQIGRDDVDELLGPLTSGAAS